MSGHGSSPQGEESEDWIRADFPRWGKFACFRIN